MSEPQFQTVQNPHEGVAEINDSQAFRWISIDQLNPDHVTWPIDKKVIELLLAGEGI
jgi:hypothetical protein